MTTPTPAPGGLLPLDLDRLEAAEVAYHTAPGMSCHSGIEAAIRAWEATRPVATPPAQPAGVITSAVVDIAEAAYWRYIDASTGRANRGRAEFRSGLQVAIAAAIAASEETL